MRCRILEARVVRFVCRRGWPAALLVLTVALAGCSGSSALPQTAEVSGTVKFKGKPLPGGNVTFVSDKGGVTGAAVIGEDGTYKVTTAPVGPVHITVDNRALESNQRAPKTPMLKRPGAEEPTTPKGKYVAIPEKYYAPDKTPLTYTVTPGTQTKDIELE
jgi:hypothetical protein